ncbi:MAG TPA: LppP/LprE family lipoprotein [Thermomicrobiaceae bacterium]|nr:LppP/LprE family lipoprotein [Thermomicrobiaceae bacterium]
MNPWRAGPALVLLALLAGCGAPSSTPAPRPTTIHAPALIPLKNDRSVIRRHGFLPAAGYATTGNGTGGLLIAWAGVCRGSADGHCQRVFFFNGDRYVGADTTRGTSPAITRVAAAGSRAFAVTYAHYAPQDPLCCPSLKPVTITYKWNGSKMVASGKPPAD